MRLKSTAVWYDLPGVEAAYMPIGAPSAVDALMNVGCTDAQGNHRMAGRYTATPGVLPTWSAATGWYSNGSQYLRTGMVAGDAWSAIVAIKNVVAAGAGFFGYYNVSNATRFGFAPNYTGVGSIWYSGGFVVSTAFADGVLGVAGRSLYKNGIQFGTAGAWSGTSGEIYLLRTNGLNGNAGYLSVAAICSRTFSPAEMWLASRQMAYCEQNPDWNAWARRRRYYYAPSAAAAIRWPGVGRSGPVGGSPGIRGSQ